MIHTFSPNWYRSQCLYFVANTLFYASNYVLYRFNLTTRRVEAEKCFRKIAIKSGMNSKDIKIHTICGLNERMIIVGINQSNAVVLDAECLEVLEIVRNIGVNSVSLCYVDREQGKESSNVIFGDEHGVFSRVVFSSPNEYEIQSVLADQLLKEKVKDLIEFNNFTMIIYAKGQVILCDKHLTKILYQLSPEQINLDQEFILSLDIWKENNKLWASMLTKSKNTSQFLHLWSLDNNSSEENVNFQFKSILKSEVKIIYPKAMNEKLKNCQKSAQTIKFISTETLLFSGKLGEIFIITLPNCPETLTIKPHSLEELPQCLEILHDPKHYKEIYAIYTHQKNKNKPLEVYTISTDQTMNIWTVQKNSIQHNFNIKFVTAELSSIFFSEADSNTVFFLLKDSIIRSATPLSKQSYFLSEHWKHTKKFKIVKAVAHLAEPGITAMLTECGKILIYDLYDDRLMKIVDLEEKTDNVINISYEYVSVMGVIEKLTNEFDGEIEHSWHEENNKVNRYYQKAVKNFEDVGLLVQQKNRLLFMKSVSDEKDEFFSIKKVCRIERIHNTKLWDKTSLLFSQYKNNNLKVWLYLNNDIIKIEETLKINGRCIFKVDLPYLRVIEFKSKKLMIHTFKIEQKYEKIGEISIELPIFAEQIVVDYNTCQAVLYNSKDDSLVSIEFTENSYKVTTHETGNKIESLSFYLSKYLVVGFKDQSLKLLNLADLPSVKDQPQKKVKRCFDGQQSSQKYEEMEDERNFDKKESRMMEMNE